MPTLISLTRSKDIIQLANAYYSASKTDTCLQNQPLQMKIEHIVVTKN